jgi:hypothetical protein
MQVGTEIGKMTRKLFTGFSKSTRRFEEKGVVPKAAKLTEQHRPREPSLARLC